MTKPQALRNRPDATPDDRCKWVALANTTASMFMATLDGSIVIIALPAILRGIHLDPLAAGNISYLLWMIMGCRLVQAVLVVTVGRLGDMFGRVRIYNSGFVVFTVASILLSYTAWLPQPCSSSDMVAATMSFHPRTDGARALPVPRDALPRRIR
jgi:MFS family permease